MIDAELLKQIDRVIKLQNNARSESEDLDNQGAAELFTNHANSLIAKFNISASDLAARRAELESKAGPSTPPIEDKLGSTIVPNPFQRINARVPQRLYWFEELAKIVASGYNCHAQATLKAEVIISGYDSDREIAIFMFQSLAQIASDSCRTKMKDSKAFVGVKKFGQKEAALPEWIGDDVFVESFHAGFRDTLQEFYENHKRDENKRIEAIEFARGSIVGHDYVGNLDLYVEPLHEYGIEVGKRTASNILKKSSKEQALAQVNGGNRLSLKAKIETRDTVYILVDVSVSMRGWKLQQAKEGALSYARVATIEKNFSVGLIKFGSSAKHLIHPQNEVNSKFEKAVESLEVGGSTNMRDAIKYAMLYFTNRRVRRVLYIITDGVPNDEFGTLQAAADAKKDGIEIMVLGTDDAKQELLDKLCSREGLGVLVGRERLALGMGEMAQML